MRRLKFLLRPGWIILALLVAAFAYLCFNVLAPWQLGKNTSTEERNSLIEDSLDSDPVAVEEFLGAGLPRKEDEWRRVVVTGEYVPGSDVLVRLRSNGGSPSYEVLTAVRLSDGTAVIVDRGYVDAVEGTKAPPVAAAPTGPVTLDGRIRLSEGTDPSKSPLTTDGYRQVYSINPPQVSAFVGFPLAEGYVQLDDDQPGGFEPVPLPQLDAGPYLSYGLQWLAFGIMAPLGLAYFARAELRERRKDREAGAAPAEQTPVPTTEPTTNPAPTPTAKETKLADRYGNRR